MFNLPLFVTLQMPVYSDMETGEEFVGKEPYQRVQWFFFRLRCFHCSFVLPEDDQKKKAE